MTDNLLLLTVALTVMAPYIAWRLHRSLRRAEARARERRITTVFVELTADAMAQLGQTMQEAADAWAASAPRFAAALGVDEEPSALARAVDRHTVLWGDQPDERCWRTLDDTVYGYQVCDEPSAGPSGLCGRHRDELTEVTP